MIRADFRYLENFSYNELRWFYLSKGWKWEDTDQEIRKIKKNLFVKLQKFRDNLRAAGIDRPIYFNSITDGRHSKNSLHYSGKAADVRIGGRGGINWNKVLQCAVTAGFTGIGYYPHWKPNRGMHLDIRAGGVKLWTRNAQGRYKGII